MGWRIMAKSRYVLYLWITLVLADYTEGKGLWKPQRTLFSMVMVLAWPRLLKNTRLLFFSLLLQLMSVKMWTGGRLWLNKPLCSLLKPGSDSGMVSGWVRGKEEVSDFEGLSTPNCGLSECAASDHDGSLEKGFGCLGAFRNGICLDAFRRGVSFYLRVRCTLLLILRNIRSISTLLGRQCRIIILGTLDHDSFHFWIVADQWSLSIHADNWWTLPCG